MPVVVLSTDYTCPDPECAAPFIAGRNILWNQVLRDKIGTAMRNKRSRADQFPLIIHDQEGEGESQEAFLEKEGAEVCGTQKMCPS